MVNNNANANRIITIRIMMVTTAMKTFLIEKLQQALWEVAKARGEESHQR